MYLGTYITHIYIYITEWDTYETNSTSPSPPSRSFSTAACRPRVLPWPWHIGDEAKNPPPRPSFFAGSRNFEAAQCRLLYLFAVSSSSETFCSTTRSRLRRPRPFDEKEKRRGKKKKDIRFNIGRKRVCVQATFNDPINFNEKFSFLLRSEILRLAETDNGRLTLTRDSV